MRQDDFDKWNIGFTLVSNESFLTYSQNKMYSTTHVFILAVILTYHYGLKWVTIFKDYFLLKIKLLLAGAVIFMLAFPRLSDTWIHFMGDNAVNFGSLLRRKKVPVIADISTYSMLA